MRVDLSTHSMRNAFQPLTENLNCELCHEGLQKRVKDIIVQWASVRVSGSVLILIGPFCFAHALLTPCRVLTDSAPFKKLTEPDFPSHCGFGIGSWTTHEAFLDLGFFSDFVPHSTIFHDSF